MQIKTVCELTGLTARAIRVYIDEQLIEPIFTENYLGRRSFDFSMDDVEMLKSIAILRKNDFSIDEIRRMINHAESSTVIVQNVKKRIEEQADAYRLRLQAFSYIDADRAYSISELAQLLSQTPNDAPIPNEPRKWNVAEGVKSVFVFIAVWLPFALTTVGFFSGIRMYAYPKVNAGGILLTLLALTPSVLILVITKIKPNVKKRLKQFLLLLCILFIPFSLIAPFGIVLRSETTDFHNYRDFDPDCLANRNEVFLELFPAWPHYFENVKNENGKWETVYLDAKYYYQFLYGMDYTYDIYAEWPLRNEDFAAEVQRARAVFEKAVAEETYGYDFVEMERGDFSCLILYDGNEPFQEVTNSSAYLIFAYCEKNNTVRYIYCDSLENGVDQPYYLQLDW